MATRRVEMHFLALSARWIADLALVLGLALATGPANAAPPITSRGADSQEDQDPSSLSPYFVVVGGDPSIDRLPLLETNVDVDVSGVIACVTVKQSYRNEGTRPIHARYVFPASTRAAVHGLTMTVGSERIVAKIKERKLAKKEFTAAKKSGKNAALLEQQRPNVFSMDVANLMPGQQIDVELQYSELLVPEERVYEFVYPTVVGPRYSRIPKDGVAETDQWVASPYTTEGRKPSYALQISVTLSAGIPITNLDCTSHAIVAHSVDPGRVTLSLDPRETDGGNRDFVLRYRLAGEEIHSGLLLYHGERENFFLMMMEPPQRVALEDIPPREFVFLIDVSGSMHGFPIQVSKALLRDLVSHLRPSDTFNLLFFSGGSTLWAERSRAATQANVEDALSLLNGYDGGGGTELLAAMRRAMSLPQVEGFSRSFVIVTDGYIAVESDVFDFIREHLDEANVFAFGIGSSVNRFLIEGMARAGQGEAFVTLRPEEAPDKARQFREYVQTPVLTDVKVHFEDFDVYDVEPPTIPDLLAARPILLYGKWRGLPQGRIVVTGRSGQGDFYAFFDVADVEPDEKNQPVRFLWARARAADLSDHAAFGEKEAQKRQLIELGLEYNLLTKHTSFIAVRELIVNPAGNATSVQQPLPLPDGVSNLAIGPLCSGDEPRLVWLLLLLVGTGVLLTAIRSRALGTVVRSEEEGEGHDGVPRI